MSEPIADGVRIERRGPAILVNGELGYVVGEDDRVRCIDCGEDVTDDWLVHLCDEKRAA